MLHVSPSPVLWHALFRTPRVSERHSLQLELVLERPILCATRIIVGILTEKACPDVLMVDTVLVDPFDDAQQGRGNTFLPRLLSPLGQPAEPPIEVAGS